MSAGDFQGTYDLSKNITIVGGSILSGYGDGDVIMGKYDEDRSFKKVGADGEVGKAKNPSKAGEITFILSATSKANDELSAICALSIIGGNDLVIPISSSDLSGRSKMVASKCWLKTAPDLSFGREIGERTWVFDCADLTMWIGGNG